MNIISTWKGDLAVHDLSAHARVVVEELAGTVGPGYPWRRLI